MTPCEICEEMGCSDNCDNCELGNPCLGCEHDKGKKNDCHGQCCEDKGGNNNDTAIVEQQPTNT